MVISVAHSCFPFSINSRPLFFIQEFIGEVDAYKGQVDSLFDQGKLLVDGGHLDKMDVEGIGKTTKALSQHWTGINDHLQDRKIR